jgi:hypothetical protein
MFDFQDIDKFDYLFRCYFYNQDINVDKDINTITELLTAVPNLYSLRSTSFSYDKHFEKAKQSYKQGLIRNHSSVDPSFILDKSFRTIFNFYVEEPLSEEDFDKSATLHKIFMGVENKFGELLEEYIASKLKDHGWVWCAGSIVNGIDLIKKDGNTWQLLQIKSRSNTENSSSNKIRDSIKDKTGSEITSWYRLNVNAKPNNDPIEWNTLEKLVNFQGFSEEDFVSFSKEKHSKSKKIYCDIFPHINDLYAKKSLFSSLEKDIEKVATAREKRQGKPPRPLTKELNRIASKYNLSNVENIDSLLENLDSKKREVSEEMLGIDQMIQALLR